MGDAMTTSWLPMATALAILLLLASIS